MPDFVPDERTRSAWLRKEHLAELLAIRLPPIVHANFTGWRLAADDAETGWTEVARQVLDAVGDARLASKDR